MFGNQYQPRDPSDKAQRKRLGIGCGVFLIVALLLALLVIFVIMPANYGRFFWDSDSMVRASQGQLDCSKGMQLEVNPASTADHTIGTVHCADPQYPYVYVLRQNMNNSAYEGLRPDPIKIDSGFDFRENLPDNHRVLVVKATIDGANTLRKRMIGPDKFSTPRLPGGVKEVQSVDGSSFPIKRI